MVSLPEDFINSIKNKLPGTSFSEFESEMSTPSPTSIRIHPSKYKKQHPEQKIEWCALGYYLDQRPKFTLDPSFHAGAYYVQEASSMFIWTVLEELLGDNLDVKILDLCASPGGKSTLIASYLANKGLLVANEILKSRAYTLKQNITKEGYSNIIVTNNDPKDFSVIEDFFDIILIDAPCSGEGMFRKDHDAIQEWSLESVSNCSLRQKRIIADVLPALKENGHIIYSTCTYNDEENIKNVDWAMKEFHLDSVEIPTNPSWNIEVTTFHNAHGYQFFLHKIKGEGFFVSVLKKKNSQINNSKLRFNDKNLVSIDKKQAIVLNQWVESDAKCFLADKTGAIHLLNEYLREDARILSNYLRLIYCGITLGTVTRDVFIPEHSLALSYGIIKEIPTLEVNHLEALLFLKKELSTVETSIKSWILLTYEGNGIGWIKNLGNRINNYLPNENKILMRID